MILRFSKVSQQDNKLFQNWNKQKNHFSTCRNVLSAVVILSQGAFLLGLVHYIDDKQNERAIENVEIYTMKTRR